MSYVLPPQLITTKEKYENKDKYGISHWMKMCMNTLESIGRIQYQENRRLNENVLLMNGQFVPYDFIDREDVEELDTLETLIKEGKLPKFMKHYDIISTPLRKIQNELNTLPDSFHVIGKGEAIQSEEMEMASMALQEIVLKEFDALLNEKLVKEGLDLSQEFETEEEQQAFNEQIGQRKQELTPEEVLEYRDKTYRHIAEIWGEHELADQKERYNLKKKRRDEFGDLLSQGKRFREIVVTPNGLHVDRVEPINVFYHKSPHIEYVQDGDYAGKIYISTISDIVNKFGMYMTADQIKSLENNWYNDYKSKVSEGNYDLSGNKIDYLNPYGLPYGHWMVSNNPYINHLAQQPIGFPTSATFLSDLYSKDNQGINFGQLFTVTQAYWKSKKKIGLLYWLNPSTQEEEKIIIDESFVIPKGVKELTDRNFIDEQPINTIIVTWINEIWEGVKINNSKVLDGTGAIYLNVQPTAYQYKSDLYLNTAKLPIAGQIINNKTTKSSSLVDNCKPEQFQYNVVMNKAMKLFERSILPFLAMDMAILPNNKDWSGEDALFKWLMGGEAATVAPVNTNQPGVQTNSGGQYPRWIDLDMTPRISALFQIAIAIKNNLYQKIGMSPERLGDVNARDTATGINTSVSKSFEATAHWFIEFFEAEKEILTMQLEAAQWLQGNSPEDTSRFVKSDFSKKYIQMNNNKMSMYDLHIYVSDAQEELRKIQAYQILGGQNTNINLPTSARMAMMAENNAENIRDIVERAEKKVEEQQAQMQQFKERELQATTELEKQKLEQEKQMFYDKLANDLKEAYIKSTGYREAGEQDLDNSGIVDALEYDKFELKANTDFEKLKQTTDKQNFEKDKEYQRRIEKQQDQTLKERELELKQEQIRQTAKNVRILDKGKYNK